MPEIQDALVIKSLLGCIVFLWGCSVALTVYIAKKYIKRSDDDHEILSQLTSEHKIFHRKDTGMKS